MDWLLFLCFTGILGMIIIYSYLYGISPTPTSTKVKNQLLSLLPEMSNIEIAELGSGWGTLAFALARHFPTCKMIGYEISPFPYFISKIISYYFAFPNLSIKRQDFFQISLKNVSIVVCYLYPGAMLRLKTKLESELAPNAYVISHTFAVPGWIPIRFERVHDLYHTPIYLYQVKECCHYSIIRKTKRDDYANFF
jgi:hypothetical protein